MDFRPLRAFIEVVRQGGFSSAAKTVCATQSTVSKAVKQLEDEIGLRLLDRIGHRSVMTAAGEVVYRRGLKLLADRDDLMAEIDEIRGVRRGALRLGLPPVGSSTIFAPLFAIYRQRFPGIEVRLTEYGSDQLASVLHAGEIDFAGALLPVSGEFEFQPVRREPLVALLPPGHPLAGAEKSGPDSGFAELFENRWCIFTPLEETEPAALERLAEFWRRCGANIDTMDPAHHDMTLAIVSHLPHIIAYNIVGTADDLQTVTKSEVIKYSASGFRDFTRLAASDPTMWRDVCLHNKDAILEMLARFSEDLASLQRAIRWGDGEKLFDLFTRTRAVRRSIIEAGQDTDAPDFGRQAGGSK